MPMQVTLNQLYSELHKSIKYGFVSHSFIAQIYSKKATICAYNGLHHTISTIVKDLESNFKKITLENTHNTKDVQVYHIQRCGNHVTCDILITAYNEEENNKIIFEFTIQFS